ncbi:MAG: hypothetical protein M3487_04590 [Actinomycetota bacterium]|nr:hypothetical protein [Actinomycetota bacterium]
MGEERRRVAADTQTHARALADNLVNQGFALSRVDPHEWELRKVRRRGDVVVTIFINPPTDAAPPPRWGPPAGRRVG